MNKKQIKINKLKTNHKNITIIHSLLLSIHTYTPTLEFTYFIDGTLKF